MHSIICKSRVCDLTFYKSGRIDISASASKLLGLTGGEVIDVLCDSEDRFFLYVKVRNPNGKYKATVYRSNKHGCCFRTNCKAMTTIIINACGATDVARLAVASPIINEHYGTLLPLITRLLL